MRSLARAGVLDEIVKRKLMKKMPGRQNTENTFEQISKRKEMREEEVGGGRGIIVRLRWRVERGADKHMYDDTCNRNRSLPWNGGEMECGAQGPR